MYFALTKLTFDDQSSAALDRKSLHALCDKLRAHFRICVEIATTAEDKGYAAIALCGLDRSSEKLSQLVDKIVAYCERSEGLRVSDEPTLIDHVDIVDEED